MQGSWSVMIQIFSQIKLSSGVCLNVVWRTPMLICVDMTQMQFRPVYGSLILQSCAFSLCILKQWGSFSNNIGIKPSIAHVPCGAPWEKMLCNQENGNEQENNYLHLVKTNKQKKHLSQVSLQHRKPQFHGVRAVAPVKLLMAELFFLPSQEQIWLGVWGIVLTMVNSGTLFLLSPHRESISLTKYIFIQHAKRRLCQILNFLCPKKKIIQVRKSAVQIYKVVIYIEPGQEIVLWVGTS